MGAVLLLEADQDTDKADLLFAIIFIETISIKISVLSIIF